MRNCDNLFPGGQYLPENFTSSLMLLCRELVGAFTALQECKGLSCQQQLFHSVYTYT